MTSQDEITRTADRLRDALGAAAELMPAGGGTVRTRGRGSRNSRTRAWLLPTSAAAGVLVITLVAGFIGRSASNSGGSTIMAAGIGPVHEVNVAAPDPSVLNTAGVQAARSRVVKITGFAPSCSRVIEGSGFVYAPQHVITNAHVIAGVTRQAQGNGQGPLVTTADGRALASRVVFYDPQIDIAVLDVPGLNVKPLAFSTQANPGDDAVVAGYPENHSYTAVPAMIVPARIAQVLTAHGQDIYHTGQVTRQIYQIRAVVEEGNSGGPLLSSDGTVDGVVFAAVVGKQDTGFALTASEIHADAVAGATATAPVSTQRCTP